MNLTNAAGRKGLAALVTVISLSMASQALAGPCDPPSGSVRPDDPTLVPTINYVLGNPNADATALGQALAACNQVLSRSGQRTHLQARMCVAEAQLRLAKLGNDTTQNYSAASCNFQMAEGLAERARRTSEQTRAQGFRVEALLGLASVSGREQADRLIADADRVHARSLQASPELHFRLYELYSERRDAVRVRREAEHLGTSSRMAALAWIGVAQLEPAQAEDALRRALNAQPRSVAVNSELGRFYFERNNPNDRALARTRLEIATTESPQPDEQRYLPSARYYLSLLVAQEDPRRAADLARDAGPSDFRYQRQACLMQLKIGHERVFDRYQEGNRWINRPVDAMPGFVACQLGDTPEARLLRAMFWLRRAQFYMPPPVLGTRAMRDYQAEVAQASRALDIQVDASTALGWPGQETSPTLREMFDYGRELTAYFDGICLGATRPSDRRTPASRVFSYYGLSDCES